MRDTRVATGRTPARAVGRFLVRHPRSTGSALVLTPVTVWLGYQTVLMAAGIAVVAGVSWRLLDRPTFDRFAGRLLRAWWRRWLVYHRRWLRLVASCGLFTQDRHGNALYPRLVALRSKWVWDTLVIKMAAGQEPEDFEKAIGRLANGFRARAANVRVLKPGKIAVDLQRREPFDDMIVTLPELGDSVESVDLTKVVLGRDEYDRAFTLDLLTKDLHILLAGATGAGKGSFQWGLLWALAPLIRAGLVRLWVIDPKGGMELSAGKPMFHAFADDEKSAVQLMRDYVATLDARKLDLGRRGIRQATPSLETPLELLICDELAALTAWADRDTKNEVEDLLGKALTQYRAPLGRIVAATQEPTKDTIPMRGLFPTKIALRLDSASYVDMCLGEGMRDMGAFADKIPTYLPGVAYVKAEGRREPLRVRAAYTTDTDIKTLVDYCTSGDSAATVHPIRPQVTSIEDRTRSYLDVDFADYEDNDDGDQADEVEEIDYLEGDEDEDEIA